MSVVWGPLKLGMIQAQAVFGDSEGACGRTFDRAVGGQEIRVV